MLPVEQAGKLRLISENTKICPEVELRLFGGHTDGQIAPYIETSAGTLVYTGDVIPLLASIPIAWVSAYDAYPVTSMEEQTRMLEEAVQEKQILFFEHDAYNECCTVKKAGEKYVADEVFTLESYLNAL
jgi:glyoxylase-like metal-dependent hydrolase (beta-lactamase superfamily II)